MKLPIQTPLGRWSGVMVVMAFALLSGCADDAADLRRWMD